MKLPPDSIFGTLAPESTPTRKAGEEPLPGYHLLEPLGSGGLGEVWKCEIAGGLCKAIKFVRGGPDQLFDALRQIQGVRHPFLLAVEHVEMVGDELLIVMELADQNLHDYCQKCLAEGASGIPRSELLPFLLEAAEALDFMNYQHDLQHLDVKPHNLFLVSNHAKVADFGLVLGNQETSDPKGTRQLTAIAPQYTAPEVFQGMVSRHSDQYSLAVVYQELLTGQRPFDGRNPRQLMMQHLNDPPNLEALPACERTLVAQALAKDPERRFGSCLEFVHALVFASVSPADWLPVETPDGLENPDDKKDSNSYKSSASLRAALAGAQEREAAAGNPCARPAQETTTILDNANETRNQLGDYQFVECLHHSPLAEVWTVRDSKGRPRLAQRLQCEESQTATVLARLRDLRHPGLHPRAVLPEGPGRLLVLEALQRRTLRERLKECVGKGLPGIPRQELMPQLEQVAEVLDYFARQQLPHLGLHPRCLVLGDDDRVFLTELGLVALTWLPGTQAAGPLNPRYSAPELDRPGGSGAADQYSLAIIFVELLTGMYPLRGRGGRGGHGRGPVKLNLDMLATTDRDVVARALEADPRHRFDTCVEFIRALKRVTEEEIGRRRQRYLQLPPVMAVAQLRSGTLLGGSAPTAAELAANAIATAAVGAQQVGVFNNFRYRIQSDKVIEHLCPVRLYQGGLQLRLQGFHEQWKGSLLHQDRTSFSYRVFGQRSLWQACIGKQPGIEIHVQLVPTAHDHHIFLGKIRMQPVGGSTEEKLFQQLGPVVLQSLRAFLQVGPEQRSRERWTFEQPLLVYPVLPTLELGEVLPARGKDISPGDLGFYLKDKPGVELAYVQLGKKAPLGDYAVLTRLVRYRPCREGFEVGAAFVSGRVAGAA